MTTSGIVAREESLSRCSSGAVTVLGLFAALVATGMVFYMVGVGEAIHHREVMQDASDASAFAAAVLHARGMSLIVLINLIMAGVLAVLVMIKVLITVVAVAMASRTLPAVTTSLGLLATPVVSVIAATIFLREPLTPSLIVAIVLILGGVALGTAEA